MAFQNEVDNVVEFLLAPFHDIVSKAKDAASNAGDDEPSMRKTAEALSKEGQRALHRLEPLCKNMSSRHGTTFMKVVRTNEDISNYHMRLTDLLWGFDDYIAVETFDGEKYTELQALCRNVAPKMYNILVRMNIELLSTMSDFDSALHIVPESPPMSPLYPMSPSSYIWQLDNKSKAEPSLLGSSSLSDSSVDLFPLGCHASHSQPGRIPYAHTAPSSSTTGLECAFGDLGCRYHSYCHSSRSSETLSSRGNSRRPTLPTRDTQEASVYPGQLGQPWPLPERLSSRQVHEAFPSSRQCSIPESMSVQGASPLGVPATRQPPAKAVPPTPVARLPSSNCIINETSSLRQYKGFCSGASEVLHGSSGVKQKHKPVHRTLSRVVAKCTGCSWELDYEHIENDQANRGKKTPAHPLTNVSSPMLTAFAESGSMSRHDVHFRLRFLQKSHVAVKRPDDRLYGCVFCAQNGYTLQESDATVFFSADDLLAHLSRHPRPLPVIPGIAVVYGTHVPSHLLNNYDLQFKIPAALSPVYRNSDEVDGRPTGVAMKEVRRDEAQRNIVDRDRCEDLQVAVGAKLTGIKWPTQYKGRRVFAWHDGNFASLASESVMLIAPTGSNLNKTMRSAVSARAKWKFSPKHGKSGWLKFDKGDTITNIRWEHPDHWWWCGTTRKGECGVFPQAFLDPNTVKDKTPGKLYRD